MNDKICHYCKKEPGKTHCSFFKDDITIECLLCKKCMLLYIKGKIGFKQIKRVMKYE